MGDDTSAADQIAELEKTVERYRQKLDALEKLIENKTAEVHEGREKLERRKNLLMTIIDSMPSMLLTVGEDGKVLLANRIARSTLEDGEKGLEERPITDLFPRSYSEQVGRWLSNTEVPPKDPIEIRMKGKGKLSIPVNLCVSVLPNSSVRYVFTVVDLSATKAMERQLLQVQKMEAVGQLAAGVAHEINTPIQYIGDNLEFTNGAFEDMLQLQQKWADLLEQLEDNTALEEKVRDIKAVQEEIDISYLCEELPKAISQSQEGVKSVTEIVKSLKALSHPDAAEMEEHDINGALENAITVTRNEWKYHADIEKQFDSNAGSISCYLGQLNQVWLNIIVNAAHAIEEENKKTKRPKGLITFTTKKEEQFVEIRITDNGPGIPKDVLSKVFDPFFTTKGVGKGTGQGLAISHSIIVDKHHGQLSVESKPGSTTFVIRLPVKQVVQSAGVEAPGEEE